MYMDTCKPCGNSKTEFGEKVVARWLTAQPMGAAHAHAHALG